MHRRLFLLLPLACLKLAPPARASTGPELSEDDVDVAYIKEMYVGRFTFLVPVSSDTAWEVLTDFERMAAFLPNLEASQVVSRQGDLMMVAQRGKVTYGPFTFRFQSERRVEMRAEEGLLLSRAVAGNTRHMRSEMRLTPDGNGTRLDYRVEMVPENWIPSSLGIGVMRHELASQFTAMAREMVRRQKRRHTT